MSLLIANSINAIGVVGLLGGHILISYRDDYVRAGFFMSATGAFLCAIGSFLLGSWPIVILDTIWCFLSLRGGLVPPNSLIKKHQLLPPLLPHKEIVALSYVIAGLLVISGEWILAAFITTLIYVHCYAAFSDGAIDRKHYLLYTMGAYFFVVPHLIDFSSYAILFNETLGFFISGWGYLMILEKEGIEHPFSHHARILRSRLAKNHYTKHLFKL